MKPVGRQSDWELSIRTADRGRSCGKARQIFVDKETNICLEAHQIFAYKDNKHLHRILFQISGSLYLAA